MQRAHVLAAFAALLSTASPAHAEQYDYRHPPIRVTATVNDLTTLRDPSDQDTRMFLYEFIEPSFADGGIRWKVWDGTTGVGSWSSWTDKRESEVKMEGALETSLAAVGGEYWNAGYGVYLPRFNAFFDYTDGGGAPRTGRPWWNWLNWLYSWAWGTPPSNGYGDGFQPYSAFTWKNGSTQRINVFGLASVVSGTSVSRTRLREQWWDGSSWRYTDHGLPSGGFYTRMGPNSAVWTNPRSSNGRGFVFVTEDDYHLYARYTGPGCSSWCWVGLGAPRNAVELRTPVAVSYKVGSKTRVLVLVAARMSNDSWRLWGRYVDEEGGDDGDYSDWQDFGGPALEANRQRGDGFDMTAAVTYWQNGRLRINVFGTTDWMDRLSSGLPTHLGGHLIEFFWDGSTWRWGLNEPPKTFSRGCETNTPDRFDCPVRFQTMSAAVVETQSWERIGVFGQDENGATWELGWNGSRWDWRTH